MSQMRANTKCPHSPHHNDEGQANTQIFADDYIRYTTSIAGHLDTQYADTQGSGQGAFASQVDACGKYEHHQMNQGTPVSTEMYPHAHRHYGNNDSMHAQNNSEKYAGGVTNRNSNGQCSKCTAADDMDGASNNSLAMMQSDHRIRSSQSSSTNYTNSSDGGIHIQTTSGESYNYHSGNVATTYGGAHYKICQGDCGTHVQKQGNWDTRVQNGKLQLQTGKGDLTVKSGGKMVINASSQITINVGSSSITIQSGQVTINAQTITLNGTCYLGGKGGQLAGTCGGGCCTKVYIV